MGGTDALPEDEGVTAHMLRKWNQYGGLTDVPRVRQAKGLMGSQCGEERVGKLRHKHIHVNEQVHLHGLRGVTALTAAVARSHLLILAKGDAQCVWEDAPKQGVLLFCSLGWSKCTSRPVGSCRTAGDNGKRLQHSIKSRELQLFEPVVKEH